jgi:hypothetical protein
MNGAAEAQSWAKELVRREARGPGDMENAMRRLEARYGIPWRAFWSLRYRPPADVMHGLWERLRQAYQAECERQAGLLRHDIETTKAKGLASAPSIRAAEALADEAEEG